MIALSFFLSCGKLNTSAKPFSRHQLGRCFLSLSVAQPQPSSLQVPIFLGQATRMHPIRTDLPRTRRARRAKRSANELDICGLFFKFQSIPVR